MQDNKVLLIDLVSIVPYHLAGKIKCFQELPLQTNFMIEKILDIWQTETLIHSSETDDKMYEACTPLGDYFDLKGITLDHVVVLTDEQMKIFEHFKK